MVGRAPEGRAGLGQAPQCLRSLMLSLPAAFCQFLRNMISSSDSVVRLGELAAANKAQQITSARGVTVAWLALEGMNLMFVINENALVTDRREILGPLVE